jgi:acetyltransferase EpsM
MSSKDLIIIGASDTFEIVEESLGEQGHRIIGYLSPEAQTHSMFKNYPHLGDDSIIALGKYPDAGYVLTLANNNRRREIFDAITAAGNEVMTVVHPQAILAPSATLGHGTVMTPLSLVYTLSKVGKGVHMSFASHAGHDVMIGDFSFIGPGAKLFGEVEVGSGVVIGANVVVLPQVKIGNNAQISAGTVVTRDVAQDVTVMSPLKTQTMKLPRA